MIALLVAGIAGAAGAGAPATTVPLTHTGLRSRMVVRIHSAVTMPPPAAELRESRGPRCIPMLGILGAAVIADRSVDFILRGGMRVRARFDASCPALDYYSGFYVTPGPDGRICADRDAVHSRAGGECAIDRFRTVAAKRK